MAKHTGQLGWRLLSGYALLFFIFIYAPLAIIIVYSFNANPVNMMIWDGFTLDWYRGLFGYDVTRSRTVLSDAIYVDSTEQLLQAVANSAVVALTTTLIATVIGTATALALARYRFRLQWLYRPLLLMPMIMPDIVLGIGLLIFFVTAGFRLGLTTIIIGHCTFLISYVFIVVQARLAGMGGRIKGGVTAFYDHIPAAVPGNLSGRLDHGLS